MVKRKVDHVGKDLLPKLGLRHTCSTYIYLLSIKIVWNNIIKPSALLMK